MADTAVALNVMFGEPVAQVTVPVDISGGVIQEESKS
jgi:hypothetical protein